MLPKKITSPEDIQDQLIDIQSFMEQPYDADNIGAVIERATKIEVYMANTSKLLADAKWHYSDVFEQGFIKAMKETSKFQASTTNLYLKALVKNFTYLVDWADRLNATCTHQLDFARTLISKIKAEMQQLQYTNT